MLYSNSRPRYFPHLNKSGLLEMGLMSIDESAWIEPDEDLPNYLSHKLRMRSSLGDGVVRALPESLEAQREFKAMLRQHLLHDHSDVYQARGASLHCEVMQQDWDETDDLPLWQASLWVADDLVIMQPSPQGYRLAAASLCSPSNWLLRDKFARPIHDVHGPLPDYRQQLGPRIARFFEHLRSRHVVQRFTWSVQAGDDLYWQHSLEPTVSPSTPLFWRVERQTLRRLPSTGALVFTIRVYVHPLEALAGVEGALSALFWATDNYPSTHAEYKSFYRLAPALEKYRSMM
jgi:hypothetical protein